MRRRQMTYRQVLDLPAMITADEAALIAGTTARNITNLANRGEVPARRVGRCWRIVTYEFLQQLGLAPSLDEIARAAAATRAERERIERAVEETSLWAMIGTD